MGNSDNINNFDIINLNNNNFEYKSQFEGDDIYSLL